MSSFAIGVFTSFFSYVFIGIGQFLQKYSMGDFLGAKSSKSKVWLAGISLSYFCDFFGNSFALSLISPAIMAPLSVVSVIVNVILAHRFLDERVSKRCQLGYLILIGGVFCVLAVSPTAKELKIDPPTSPIFNFVGGKNNINSNVIDIVAGSISTLQALITFILIVSVQLFLVWLVILRRTRAFAPHIIGSGLFGATSLLCSKIIAMILKIGAFGDGFILQLLDLRVAFLVFYLVFNLVVNETIRQLSMSKFPIAQYQSNVFAAFNVIVIFESILILQDSVSITWFPPLFTIGIILMYAGSRLIKNEKTVVLGEDPNSKSD